MLTAAAPRRRPPPPRLSFARRSRRPPISQARGRFGGLRRANGGAVAFVGGLRRRSWARAVSLSVPIVRFVSACCAFCQCLLCVLSVLSFAKLSVVRFVSRFFAFCQSFVRVVSVLSVFFRTFASDFKSLTLLLL